MFTYCNATFKKSCLLTLCFILLGLNYGVAQCNSNNANTCGQANAIACFPFSGVVPEVINNNSPFPGCPTSTLTNTTWYSFEVLSNNIGISVIPSCNQNSGIKAGLYTDCAPNAPALGVQCTCTNGPINFAANVNPGTYYLMIDGCLPDDCSFEIVVTAGTVNEPGIGDVGDILISPDPFCEGDIVEFSVPPVSGAESYEWIFPQGVTIISEDCNTVAVIWDSPAATVSVIAISSCGTATSDPILVQPGASTESFVTGTYCQGAQGYSYPGDGQIYQQGLYTILFQSQSGCDSIIFLEVIEEIPTPFFFFDEACENEIYEFNGQFFFVPVDTLLVLPGAAQNGCDSLVQLFVFAKPPPFATAVVSNASCGDCNGSIDVEIYNCFGCFTFWNNGVIGEDLTDLCPGTYTLIIKEFNCYPEYFDFIVEEETADSLSLNTTISDVDCAETCTGGINLNIECGQSPFTILWSDTTYNGMDLLTGLCAGDYAVTVTDSIGITVIDTFTINEPEPLEVSININDVFCNGESNGSININASGGTAAYTYDIFNFPTAAPNIGGLSAGAYELTVTDRNNCTFEVPFDIDEPTELLLTAQSTNVDCNNLGSILAVASGGTAPYTYFINNSMASIPGDFNNLLAGVYDVYVVDGNNCLSTIITIEIENDCCLMEIALSGTDVSCLSNEDGTIALAFVTEGVAPYTYEWFPALPNDSVQSNLMEGIYTVLVTDAQGCVASDTIEIAKECCPTFFHVEATNESCLGINDGAAEIIIDTLSNPPYSIEWSDPSLPAETEVANLPAGNYSVTLTNADGCTTADTFEIHPYLEIEIDITTADCDGTGGSAIASASGFFIYYSWSNGGSGPVQRNLDVGEYTVTAWSIFGGCQSQLTFNIELDSSCNEILSSIENPIQDAGFSQGLSFYKHVPVQDISMTLAPNPVRAKGQLNLFIPQQDRIQLSVFDSNGRLIKVLENVFEEGNHVLELDMTSYEDGIYFIKIFTQNGYTNVLKWVKVNE